eukprot:SAG31_NODE_3171_length_4590_cov_5.721443_3_plen_103_part_00
MGPYRRVCGGVGGHHPAYELQHVDVVDSTHPITAGVSSFSVHDEQHYTFIDEHRGAKLLLKNRGSDGRESCGGWAFEYGAFENQAQNASSLRRPLTRLCLCT